MIQLTDEEIEELAGWDGDVKLWHPEEVAKAQLKKVWDEWKTTKVVLLDLENHPVAYDREAVEAFWDSLLEEVK